MEDWKKVVVATVIGVFVTDIIRETGATEKAAKTIVGVFRNE